MVTRSLTIAKTYSKKRDAFELMLADKQSLRHRIADAETRFHAVRTMVHHTADLIKRGKRHLYRS